MSKIYYTNNSKAKYEMEINSNEIIRVQPNNNNKNNNNDRLSIFKKLCFASAGLPFQAYSCVISILLNVFLLERAGIKAEKTIYIFFISRMIDAITVN